MSSISVNQNRIRRIFANRDHQLTKFCIRIMCCANRNIVIHTHSRSRTHKTKIQRANYAEIEKKTNSADLSLVGIVHTRQYGIFCEFSANYRSQRFVLILTVNFLANTLHSIRFLLYVCCWLKFFSLFFSLSRCE